MNKNVYHCIVVTCFSVIYALECDHNGLSNTQDAVIYEPIVIEQCKSKLKAFGLRW